MSEVVSKKPSSRSSQGHRNQQPRRAEPAAAGKASVPERVQGEDKSTGYLSLIVGLNGGIFLDVKTSAQLLAPTYATWSEPAEVRVYGFEADAEVSIEMADGTSRKARFHLGNNNQTVGHGLTDAGEPVTVKLSNASLRFAVNTSNGLQILREKLVRSGLEREEFEGDVANVDWLGIDSLPKPQQRDALLELLGELNAALNYTKRRSHMLRVNNHERLPGDHNRAHLMNERKLSLETVIASVTARLNAVNAELLAALPKASVDPGAWAAAARLVLQPSDLAKLLKAVEGGS